MKIIQNVCMEQKEMVKRNGFVSNSSSSSFFIYKKDLTAFQIEMIRNHVEHGKVFNRIIIDIGNYYKDDDDELNDDKEFEVGMKGWYIEEDNESISGFTDLDNFDMEKFFEYIGIDDKIIDWKKRRVDYD